MGQSLNVSGLRFALQMLWRPQLLVPHITVPDMRLIPFEKLRDSGIRYMVFDKDNCLTAPYVDHLHPPFQTAWDTCRRIFPDNQIVIVSNSAGTADDAGYLAAETVERALGVPVLRHRVKKPACASEIIKYLGANGPEEVAVVGDRLATDVAMANESGMLSVWTRDIITAQGDNAMAALLRRGEHRLLDLLRSFNVKPPNTHKWTDGSLK
ncbi:hypothetical protein GGI07_004529 [Coemansia sp. Benny D115]|nr:hypothetical protein GGI07_004529 [Coemansia sp. Benny D115]